MATVTVISTIAATCHYWFSPQAKEDTSGAGVTVPNIVYGWVAQNSDGTPATLSLDLDDSYTWGVEMRFRNAPPVIFEGFQPSDGDLLTQLSAQGWVSL